LTITRGASKGLNNEQMLSHQIKTHAVNKNIFILTSSHTTSSS